eukprot:1368838-Pleurochrysis_carterae.AAC.1
MPHALKSSPSSLQNLLEPCLGSVPFFQAAPNAPPALRSKTIVQWLRGLIQSNRPPTLLCLA